MDGAASVLVRLIDPRLCNLSLSGTSQTQACVPMLSVNRDGAGWKGTNDMSNDLERYSDPDNATVALFLLENDADELTDILVAALDEAFRILDDEASSTTLH